MNCNVVLMAGRTPLLDSGYIFLKKYMNSVGLCFDVTGEADLVGRACIQILTLLQVILNKTSPTWGHPACVTFFQDRLCFAGNYQYPQRIRISMSGDYENFSVGKESGTVTDDSAISVNLLSLSSYQITHLNAGYDLTLHLITGRKITDSAFAQEPDSIIYFVSSDGEILCLTYIMEQKVYGWSHIVTDGSVESIFAAQQGNNDVVYAVVARTINGETVRYIERFALDPASDN